MGSSRRRHRRRAGRAGVAVKKVFKIAEGRPNVLDMIKNGEIQFIINTPSGKMPRADEVKIRTAALARAHPDHDDAAGGVGERERHSLAAARADDGEEPAGISTPLRRGSRASGVARVA